LQKFDIKRFDVGLNDLMELEGHRLILKEDNFCPRI
jgi:hypothetical protein